MTSTIIQAQIPQLVVEMTKINLPDDDCALIEQALKQLRNIAVGHKYGGMERDYLLSRAAIEAWERVKAR